jgi:hypothetical protein
MAKSGGVIEDATESFNEFLKAQSSKLDPKLRMAPPAVRGFLPFWSEIIRMSFEFLAAHTPIPPVFAKRVCKLVKTKGRRCKK